MAQACLATLALFCSSLLQAGQPNPVGEGLDPSKNVDLAKSAAAEHLPQVSAALLRTEIQQETDPAKRLDLARRLVMLLVSTGRYDEALAVVSTLDVSKDPSLAYWKAMALLGTADESSALSAKEILSSLGQIPVPGVSPDQLTLSLSRALRGSNDPATALALLEKVPSDSPLEEDITLEKAAALLALGRADESQKVLQATPFTTEEGKAAKIYFKALAAWRAGTVAEARKLFSAVPPATPWMSSSSALGAALCCSASTKYLQGIDLLEKRIDAADEVPLLEEEFRLLDELYVVAAIPDTVTLAKWSEDSSKPSRARLATYYRALGELRLKHAEAAESLLETFIKNYPDDSLADQARLKLAASKLQRGLAGDALSVAVDHPSSPSVPRAKLAYLRGLAEVAVNKPEEAKKEFQLAQDLDHSLEGNALFNQAVMIAATERGMLDVSQNAQAIASMNAGLPSQEMKFQIALDLARRGQASGLPMIQEVADQSDDPSLKSRARLAAAELNMKSGKDDVAIRDLAKAVHENSGDPEREEYLNVFLKDTGKKSDNDMVIAVARAFLKAHPESKFVPEVRLKLAEALLSSGDVQGARVEFEQLGSSSAGSEAGRRALFLAAQSASRAMDPASLDDALMLLERVAGATANDQLGWQARLQEGALKNAQNLPLEALAIYDRILSFRSTPETQGVPMPDLEIRAAALMAKGDTLHQLGAKDPSRETEAVKTWQQLASDPQMPLRWRNQALCKSGLILEKTGQEDAAIASYYEAFKNRRDKEVEQLWHDKAAFEAARLLERRKQWSDAVALYGQIVSEGGPRAEEAKARLSKLRLENFLWEN
jgi:tetratricopeptide (TPR) repeat protein